MFKKVKIECLNCGNEFEAYISSKRVYCSKRCKDLSPISRKKVSDGMMGNTNGHSNKGRTGVRPFYNHSKETKEKISSSNMGKKLSEETKEKMKGNKNSIGEKNGNWKGGITPENKIIRAGIQFRLWRESVFARDEYTCQKCDEKGINLNSHHIQNFAQYPGLRFAIDNGITLCRDCHYKFHKKYGFTNNIKEQIIKFINNK